VSTLTGAANDQPLVEKWDGASWTIRMEDNDPNVALDSWSGFSDPTATGLAYRASRAKGATVIFKFSGTGITWITRKGPASGIAAVTIDGVKKANVDLYAASPASFSQGYSGLSSKSHTIVITVTGTKDAAASGSYVNFNGFVVGFVPTLESSPAITYDSWTGATSKSASGGSYRVSTKTGATASLLFTGTGIEWITATGPSAGKATVSIDGVSEGTVDLYASAVHWQVAETFSGLATGTHTIVITVLGKKDASSVGTQVIVDSFIIPS
jgi:hypothetical protein